MKINRFLELMKKRKLIIIAFIVGMTLSQVGKSPILWVVVILMLLLTILEWNERYY